ncbi:MAG: MBL fold metallo-hydrolase [Smithella sp.]|nr:MBL fold metallo-hydrolase [Smithella sp.]MDM7986699.1 MBL fold metallo-hydrolase [Smithella sp.]HOU52197.1 MBL fold metallo-hydrolase [Smithella sp.]HQG66838.1 MBL fold metallo-hydrolase [Smithella sp.]HQH17044.1 MBL fold metallo-hydrolase [Smithella sp.]
MAVQLGKIRFICGDNGGKYPFNHSVYLEGKDCRVVIDPSCGLQKLTDLQQNDGVDQVWMSHWHEDHMGFLNLFDGCTLRISERDFPPLTDMEIFLDWYNIREKEFRELWKNIMLNSFNYRPQKEALFLQDDSVIDLGLLKVQVIATPGHTPGHLSFFFPDEEILFLGDYDLTTFGPWYGDLYSSIEQTIDSIHRLKSIPARRWIASHNTGLFQENPGNLWDDYENVIYQREEKIVNFLKEPKTLEDILAAWLMYGKPREPKEFFEFNERALIMKHIDYLERHGKITLHRNKYVRI